ncbi:hypothetical protein GQ43DRAFT_439629 [Delitschia confertaspora ATCC 74209]|uniref:Rhodopsin domain-containing protein n=1 Tax=Delitschia confertaspora ATCC 74209 TaxID=1513339 RepID=A0A9P4JN31_9PLEO|nr:hypothetical protein GQ43DRAFT_439629 [Delitschia confertaspora ATCC 74209]
MPSFTFIFSSLLSFSIPAVFPSFCPFCLYIATLLLTASYTSIWPQFPVYQFLLHLSPYVVGWNAPCVRPNMVHQIRRLLLNIPSRRWHSRPLLCFATGQCLTMRFDVESWIWYALAVSIIVARLISRSLLFGCVKSLQYDDWIMGILVTSCYTVLIVMSNLEMKSQSNLLPPDFDISSLTLQQIEDRETGSKIGVVVEQMQIAVIWACKSCLLILYHRLTHMVATKENLTVKLLAIYIALGFVVMEILYFAAWCHPFHEYWAVPTDNTQCNALTHHRITNAVFNISSDIIMLGIALPMFIRSLLPLKRKLILCCIFSLGIFVILAALLNKYYSFTVPYQPAWVYWYVREASTAILVANLPFTWTLLRKLFNLSAFDEEHPPPATYHSARTAGGRTQRKRNNEQTHSGRVEKQGSGNHGSHGTQRTSFIGSICASKDEGATVTRENRENSQKGLLSGTHSLCNLGTIDLERGDSSVSAPIRARPASTCSSYFSSTRLSIAQPHNHLSVPPKVYASRVPSIASTERSPPSVSGGTAIGAPVGTGGGRSAGDRKMRAKRTHS